MAWTQDERKLVERIHTAVERMQERCDYHTQLVADHEVILDGPAGNGTHPGLKSRVKSLEEFRGGMKSAVFVLWGVVSAVISGLLIAWFS